MRFSLLFMLAAALAGAADLPPHVTLSEALKIALANSTTIRQALARLDQTSGQYQQSRSALLPQLDVYARQSYQTINLAGIGIDLPGEPGLIGPFAASLMERWGLRRIVLAALALLAASVAMTTRMHTQWELTLLWGILVGSGTGVTSMVLAAVVATRWFDERRSLVVGLLSAANATGQLLFLPMLARLIELRGWRAAALIVAGAAVVVFAIVAVFMRDRPEDIGLKRYGWRATD